MNTATTALHGLNILVTRPKELASTLAKLIEHEGGNAILYPVINIEDTNAPTDRDNILARLSTFDIAIFVSPTAVRKTFENIKALPSTLQVAAIGSSTEKTLNNHNVVVSIRPEGHTSEDLLNNDQLQADKINGMSVVIFRGTGGREQLGDSLNSRGAKVCYAEMYQRIKPPHLASLSDDELNHINLITITSNEGLQNLFDLTSNKTLLMQKALIVPGSRCKKLAEALGFTEIVQSDNATDSACIDTLKTWAHQQKAPA